MLQLQLQLQAPADHELRRRKRVREGRRRDDHVGWRALSRRGDLREVGGGAGRGGAGEPRARGGGPPHEVVAAGKSRLQLQRGGCATPLTWGLKRETRAGLRGRGRAALALLRLPVLLEGPADHAQLSADTLERGRAKVQAERRILDGHVEERSHQVERD
eukprot:CAMPEP_0180190302 /NCGR_PEP_ID=MMETSP0987-20121128/809_1 /TAXON_ID=697907 /ORGANISM="non described non described, Strain CCMP2293" /LENGTH=159 /DNA_ID=CAMNT_0022144723 /DNA_START=176 /DNA_END=655 /DNA_ORIENTATION=+